MNDNKKFAIEIRKHTRDIHMDSNTILSNVLQEEFLYFYNHIRDFDEKRKIDTAIVDDVYAKVLEYDMCDAQRDAVIKTGTALNNSNGTVIFAPTRDKTTLVVLSKQVLPKKDLDEVHGTILHELTHAHDFYDYADFLQISDHNALFDSQYYHAFFYWTEFHARKIGYKRFIEYKFRKGWKQFKKHRYEFLEGIKANLSIHSSKGRLYDLMQAAGRYYTFMELCPSHTENFIGDILEGNVKTDLFSILDEVYHFLADNNEFEQFINNITIFDDLLQKIDSIVHTSA